MKKQVKEEMVKKSDYDEVRNQLARALADYDNLRKRGEAEKYVWEKMAASKVVLKLLPVLDMLENAQKHLNDQGLAIVINDFQKSLIELGVEEIKINVGDEFDPLEEEVVETVDGGKENTIAEVVQRGWKIKDESFIVRPAKVKVYGKTETK